MLQFIGALRRDGVLSEEQAQRLAAIESGALFSVHAELRAMLYLGALLTVGGVGEAVRGRLDLAPVVIMGILGACVAAGLAYCFAYGRPFSRGETAAPSPAFDYVLYLACALLGVAFGFMEAKYHLLAASWHYYLLASGALFLALAYRFDNRLVLATGLANLAGWLGVRFSLWSSSGFGPRERAIAFGLAACSAGLSAEARGFKAHFSDVYMTGGLNALLGGLLAGAVGSGAFADAYGCALLAVAGLAFRAALRRRRFQYAVFSALYAYIGVSARILKTTRGGGSALYLVVSALAVTAALFYCRRFFEERA